MTDIERELDVEIQRQSSPQFYSILVGVFIVFAIAILIPLVLLLKLRAPQPAVAAAPTSVSAPGAVAPPPVAGSIIWEASYESAMDIARQTGKPVMVDFYTDWCGVCKRLDAETFPASEVIAESQNFVSVRVNAEVRTDLAQQHGISKYPTILFLDSGGNALNRFEGSYPPAGFVQQMQSARSRLG